MGGLTEAFELGVNGWTAPFDEGTVAVGPVEVTVNSSEVDGGRRLDLAVRNPGRHVVALHDVLVRLAARPEQVLEHGHQAASVVRRCRPDDQRPERSALAGWVRGCHFSRPDGAGLVVAGDQFLLTCEGVAGFLDARRHLGTVEAGPGGVTARALLDGVPLDPGDRRRLDPLWLADGDPGIRYSDFASLWGLNGDARISSPSPVGWSSRYQYRAAVRPEHLRANLEAAARHGLDLVQLDEGLQGAIGDWLTTDPQLWPSGLHGAAGQIGHAGLKAGLWSAPFLVGEDSQVLRDHPHWVVATSAGGGLGLPGPPLAGGGGRQGGTFVLDTTRPEVVDHLRHTYAALVAEGFEYHKIDHCYAGALPGRRHDPTVTRAEALRAGLEAVREGLGEETFLLGASCPFGPAVGIVDAMRVSADAAPAWRPQQPWPGLAEAAPAAVNAVVGAVLRAPLHRRVFINDPDCLLLRPTDTGLEAWQRSFLATVITGTGAFTVVSDDLGRYTEAEWGLLDALRSVHLDVDTLLDIEDPFADPLVVRSAIGTELSVDWRDDAPGGPSAILDVGG